MAMPSKAKRPRRLAPRSCLGPVADLEAHLPEEWWRKLFNALYVKTDGDVVENRRTRAARSTSSSSAAAIQPHSHILDLCCGQGRHCLELARRGFRNVMGARPLALSGAARQEAGAERGPAGRLQGRRRAQPAAAGEQLRLRCHHGQLVRLLLQQAGRREGPDRGRQDPAPQRPAGARHHRRRLHGTTTSTAARGSGSTSTTSSAASARYQPGPASG